MRPSQYSRFFASGPSVPLQTVGLAWIRSRVLLFGTLGLLACLLTGCGPQTPASVTVSSEIDAAGTGNDRAGTRSSVAQSVRGDVLLASGSADKLRGEPVEDRQARQSGVDAWETWDVYQVAGETIGFSHVSATPQTDGTIRYRLHDRMHVRRGDSVLRHDVRQQCRETAAGELIDFAAEVSVNDSQTRYRGTVDHGQLLMEVERDAEISQRMLDWQRDCRGLLATQQILMQLSRTSGEQRKFTSLLPIQYELGETTLTVNGSAMVTLLDGQTVKLTQVDSQLRVGDAAVDSTIWIDDQGHALKMDLPALSLTVYRTDQATALALHRPQKDLLTITSVPLPSLIANPLEITEQAFRLHSKTRVPLRTLAIAAGQRVKTTADHGKVQVLVHSGLDRDSELEPATQEDLAPSPLVDFQDPLVQELSATNGGPNSAQPMAVALQLTAFVHQYVHNKNLEHGFARASEVARSRAGDCTEHAVLLAALLRARRIPVRVVAGVTYIERQQQPQMLFHMWNVAYVDDGWLPLDATLGTVAPASRIALVTTSLADGGEYSCVMPIVAFLGQVRIEPIAAP